MLTAVADKNTKGLWSGSAGIRHPHYYTNTVQTPYEHKTAKAAKAAALALYAAKFGA